MTDEQLHPGENGPEEEAGTAVDEDFDTEVETDLEADDAEQTVAVQPEPSPGVVDWQRLVVLTVLPALVLLLGVGAGVLGWKSHLQSGIDAARTESVAAAREATVAMLSYRTETVEQDLMAARDWITGAFLDSYTNLVTSTVIPNAREKKISARTRVPAAASVSAERNRAAVLVFINQSITVGSEPAIGTPSSVRVSMEKVGDRWLVSDFDPV